MTSTLTEYLQSQEELLQEAAIALPHQFSRCTYSLGPLRQAVYLCLTCPEARGLCSACSIACHTDHEQVELFPKRNFRCDCPTTAIAQPCTLHKILEEGNTSNPYSQNFSGKFCRCGRPYDAKTEREAMIQCLTCEDWFHESCCNLRDRPSSREASPVDHPGKVDQIEDGNDVDGVSDTSSSGLPPPLISGDDYEAFICGSCVSRNPTLVRWAGTPGIMMVVRDSSTDAWRSLSGTSPDKQVDFNGLASPIIAGTKRPLSPSVVDVPEAKRARADTSLSAPSRSCLAPPPNPAAGKVFENYAGPLGNVNGTGDLFLSEGFRNRWCHCSSCFPALETHQYLLEEEETYEPPEDPDSGLSLEELGMRALERLPRDRAIEGIHAFNGMRDDLMTYLRPFAQEGKVVNESDVRDFFALRTAAAKKN